MTTLSFFRSALVALVLSISASLIYFSSSMFFSSGMAIRLTLSAVTFGYVLYLLSKTNTAFGKLSFISLYLVSSALLLILWPVTLEHALFSVGFIWLVRTVYYHSNFFYALIDLVFSAVSFTAALGAIAQSHSIFMSFWSFFLTQALILPVLHYFFTRRAGLKNTGAHSPASENASEQRFYQAHNNAKNALVKLATTT